MLKKLLLGTVLSLIMSSANAALISYDILNLTNEGQSSSNVYTGNGYVGMYNSQFNGIFGVELQDYSRTALQVDISALFGKTINSAYLKFTVNNSSQVINLTSFSANGTLGHFWNAPNNLFSGSAVSTMGSNTIDVKNYLLAGLAANTGWFGLHLKGTTSYQWIPANRVNRPDAASVRLEVDYSESTNPKPVSSPTPISLLGLSLAGLALLRRKTKAK